MAAWNDYNDNTARDQVAPPWGFGNDGMVDVRFMVGGRFSDPGAGVKPGLGHLVCCH